MTKQVDLPKGAIPRLACGLAVERRDIEEDHAYYDEYAENTPENLHFFPVFWVKKHNA